METTAPSEAVFIIEWLNFIIAEIFFNGFNKDFLDIIVKSTI